MTPFIRHPATRLQRNIAALAAACLMAFFGQSLAMPPEGAQHSPFHAWFESQVVPDGSGRSCCSEADGHIIEEDDWRIVAGDYEVRIGPDEWLKFPNTGQGNHGNTVLGYTANPTGHPVAWYIGKWPLCLAEGTVS